MCDTIGIGQAFTGTQVSIFGKNSDREADETHLVLSVPGMAGIEPQDLKCTYITIPQVPSTHAMVLCKPFWIWGAEMGVNEMGVAIGNEALFTKVRPEKKPGLIGMDLLRLALERAGSAPEAAEVITGLLTEYGQGGPCGYRDKRFSYMNSFIIMDRKDILTLETVGRDYALKRHGGHAAISNKIIIKSDWDSSSLSEGTDFSSLTDPITTFFAGSGSRKSQNDAAMNSLKGALRAVDTFGMLRSHYGNKPYKGFNCDVCMHACDPLIRRSQTTGSMVVELHPDNRFRIFVTAGSAPCLTPFKPYMPAVPYPDAGRGGSAYSMDSYWWRHEAYHVSAMLRYDSIWPLVHKRIAEQEMRWAEEMPAHEWNATGQRLADISHQAFAEAEKEEQGILAGMRGKPGQAFCLSHLYLAHLARRSAVPAL